MKKIFSLLALSLMVVFTSCQKGEVSSNSNIGSEVEVSINAQIPNEVLTKGHGDASVTRFIMEVYEVMPAPAAPEFYGRYSQDNGNFNLRLITGKTYDFVFWADKQSDSSEPYYTTTGGLKVISMVTPYAGNKEERDAFFGSITGKTVNFGTNLNEHLELRRPFAQLNIASALTDIPANYMPKKVKITFNSNICNQFDAFAGVATGAATTAWSGAADITDSYAVYGDGSVYTNLATDYIFSDAVGNTVDFTMEFYNAAGEVVTSRNFPNIPLKRNYRTNIVGELMTMGGEINIDINPIFEGEINFTNAENLQVFKEALLAGKSYIVYESLTPDVRDVIAITSLAETAMLARDITIVFTGGKKNIGFTFTNYDGIIRVINYGSAEDIVNSNIVVVSAPKATMYFSGNYMTLTPGAKTTYIDKDAVVRSYTIHKGGVAKVYGRIINLVDVPGAETAYVDMYSVPTSINLHNSTSSRFYWAARQAGDFAQIIANNSLFVRTYNDGIVMANDITFDAAQLPLFFTGPFANGYVVNGNGYTLTVPTTTNLSNIRNVFTTTQSNVKIKNIKITNGVDTLTITDEVAL